jgi:nicotinate phosphoribosyltransferase
VLKLSAGKVSLPDAKQVFRFVEGGYLHHDVIALHDEAVDDAEPLLEPVMADGHIVAPIPSLGEVRERFRHEFGQLDEKYKAIRGPDIFPIYLSPGLQELKGHVERQVVIAELEASRQDRELGESR